MPIENVNTVNTTQVQKPDSANQTAKIQTVTKPYPNDTVEISTQKPAKKQSKTKKLAIGIGTGFAALVGVAILFAKHQNSKFSKLYKDKLVLSNLAEKIDFKEAKTLEEAMKFTREILGIKDVDENFTLEALNIANKGLVEVSNANKGKLFMPTTLRFETLTQEYENFIAYVVSDIESKEFGNLVINKKYFENSFLDKRIRHNLYTKEGEPFFTFDAKGETKKTSYFINDCYAVPNKDLAKLIKEYYNNPNTISVSDKRKLLYSFIKGYNKTERKYRSPIERLTVLKEKNAEFLKKHNIDIDIERLSKQTTEKQADFLKNILRKMYDNQKYSFITYKLESPASTIHHEMGHLQDFAKNLKELDLKKWKFSWKEIWKNAKHIVDTGKDLDRTGIDEVSNRWGAITESSMKKLFDEKPNKFKKLYPELYEFLTNQEIQQTAGKVSGYAQVGIGEFVAETYAKMIAKEKLPEDVMALYKKYNGPTLPA